MKKFLVTTMAILMVGMYSIAQKQYIPPTYGSNDRTEENKDFTKNHVFVGGSLALGFGSYSFNVGATPEVGYSFNNWFDAGLAVNFNYQSIRADPYYNGNIGQKSFNYGGGPFLRVYPLNQFFIQGQFEHNWADYSYTDMNQGGTPIPSFHVQSNSFLAGIGFTQRIIGQSSFYTLIMMDLMTDQYSPYRDYNNIAIPIIRAGFTFYLHPKK